MVVCAVSGSGPAYFELFAEVIAQTAASLGMRYEDARELVLQTMLGTARLVIETGRACPMPSMPSAVLVARQSPHLTPCARQVSRRR